MTKVIPIPKPRKPATNITSYRPISLLDILGKILEKIIQCHLLEFITKHNIIIPQQFGYRQNHLAINYRVTENIMMEKNKKRTTQLILLNLNKAFDSVGTTP